MGKVAVVTGASRGIGAAIARRLGESGYSVVIGYRTGEEPAKALAGSLPDAAALFVDVRSSASVGQFALEVQRLFGTADVLVSNAGIARQQLFSDVTEQDWDELFDVNVKGAYRSCQAFLPGMIRRKSGSVILISSIWGIAGASCEVAYSAAKAALIGMTKALAKELGPSNIRVNCIAPGVIDTQMNAALTTEALAGLREETPLGKIGTPEDIAAAAAFLAGEDAAFITGQILSPNGGIVM